VLPQMLHAVTCLCGRFVRCMSLKPRLGERISEISSADRGDIDVSRPTALFEE